MKCGSNCSPKEGTVYEHEWSLMQNHARVSITSDAAVKLKFRRDENIVQPILYIFTLHIHLVKDRQRISLLSAVISIHLIDSYHPINLSARSYSSFLIAFKQEVHKSFRYSRLDDWRQARTCPRHCKAIKLLEKS